MDQPEQAFSIKEMIEAHSIAPEIIRRRSSPVEENQPPIQQQQPTGAAHPPAEAQRPQTHPTGVQKVPSAAAAAAVAGNPSKPEKKRKTEKDHQNKKLILSPPPPAPPVGQHASAADAVESPYPTSVSLPRPSNSAPDESELGQAVFSPMQSSNTGAAGGVDDDGFGKGNSPINQQVQNPPEVGDSVDGFSTNPRPNSRSPTPQPSVAVVAGSQDLGTVSETGDDNTSYRQQQEAVSAPMSPAEAEPTPTSKKTSSKKKTDKKLLKQQQNQQQQQQHVREDSGGPVGSLVGIPAVEGGAISGTTPSAAAAAAAPAPAAVVSSPARPRPNKASSRMAGSNPNATAIIPVPPVVLDEEETVGPHGTSMIDSSAAATPHHLPPRSPTGRQQNSDNAAAAVADAAAAQQRAPTDAELLGPFLHLHGAMTTALGGLFVIGPQPKVLAATCIMILVPFIMIAGGVFPHLDPALIFLDVVFTLFTVVFLFKTAFTDPGFVPKRSESASDFDPSTEQSITLFWSTKGTMEVGVAFRGEPVPVSPARDLEKKKKQVTHALEDEEEEDDEDGYECDDEDDEAERQKRKAQRRQEREKKRREEDAAAAEQEETVQSFPFRIRFCHTCNRYRAPRTFHCDVCRACVDTYDHHCSFTGTCIGAGNYAPFLGFMCSLQLSIAFYFISVIAGPVQLSWSADVCLSEAMTMMGWMPVLVIIIVFLVAFGPIALFILHVYLASKGLTTMEHLREKFVEVPNPFDRGFLRNWLRALGAPDPACETKKYDGLILAHEREMQKFR